MKIYLSPSNQTGNRYAYGSTNECEECNRIAEVLEARLRAAGFDVRRAPKGQDMNVSIRESNTWGADLHIPIHTNAGGGAGPLVMVYSKAPGNLKYAQPIYDALLAASPGKKGYGVRLGTEMTPGNYMPAELSDTLAVAVYVEAEFHDDNALARWIVENPDTIAEAIAVGISRAEGKPLPARRFYRVQVGAFASRKNAEALKKELQEKGYDPFVVEVETP